MRPTITLTAMQESSSLLLLLQALCHVPTATVAIGDFPVYSQDPKIPQAWQREIREGVDHEKARQKPAQTSNKSSVQEAWQ